MGKVKCKIQCNESQNMTPFSYTMKKEYQSDRGAPDHLMTQKLEVCIFLPKLLEDSNEILQYTLTTKEIIWPNLIRLG